MIENQNFDNIIKEIQIKEGFSLNEDYIIKPYSSFLILEEFFLKATLKIHKRIYGYFDENYNKPSFNEKIKKKILNILYLIAQTNEAFQKAKKL